MSKHLSYYKLSCKAKFCPETFKKIDVLQSQYIQHFCGKCFKSLVITFRYMIFKFLISEIFHREFFNNHFIVNRKN